MKVKVALLHPNAKIPTRANPNDAGADLTAVSVRHTSEFIEYDTGVAIQLEPGYVAKIYARSSISKYDLVLCNSVGIIDVGYCQSIKLRFKSTEQLAYPRIYEVGDRIGQIIVEKLLDTEFEEVDTIEGNREGFGSTDVKKQ